MKQVGEQWRLLSKEERKHWCFDPPVSKEKKRRGQGSVKDYSGGSSDAGDAPSSSFSMSPPPDTSAMAWSQSRELGAGGGMGGVPSSGGFPRGVAVLSRGGSASWDPGTLLSAYEGPRYGLFEQSHAMGGWGGEWGGMARGDGGSSAMVGVSSIGGAGRGGFGAGGAIGMPLMQQYPGLQASLSGSSLLQHPNLHTHTNTHNSSGGSHAPEKKTSFFDSTSGLLHGREELVARVPQLPLPEGLRQLEQRPAPANLHLIWGQGTGAVGPKQGFDEMGDRGSEHQCTTLHDENAGGGDRKRGRPVGGGGKGERGKRGKQRGDDSESSSVGGSLPISMQQSRRRSMPRIEQHRQAPSPTNPMPLTHTHTHIPSPAHLPVFSASPFIDSFSQNPNSATLIDDSEL